MLPGPEPDRGRHDNLTDDTSELQLNVANAHSKVDELERLTDPETKEERLSSILNRLGINMTQWALRLDLEHSGNPVRLDLKNLTVVVDSAERPIPLSSMGAGKNWVGYHLIAHLALHQHFSQ